MQTVNSSWDLAIFSGDLPFKVSLMVRIINEFFSTPNAVALVYSPLMWSTIVIFSRVNC